MNCSATHRTAAALFLTLSWTASVRAPVTAGQGSSTWRVATEADFLEGTTVGATVLGDPGAVRIHVPIVNTLPADYRYRGAVRSRNVSGHRSSSGMFVQTYHDRDWIYLRVLDENEEIVVDSLRANDQRCGRETRCSHVHGNAAILEDGTLMVAWQIEIDGLGYRTRAQMFSAEFNAIGSNIGTFSYSKNQIGNIPRVFAPEDPPEFWVMHLVGASGENSRMVVRRFDPHGSDLGESFLNPTHPGHRELDPELLQLSDGTIVVGWTGSTTGDSRGQEVFARRYTRALEPLTGVIRVNDDAGGAAQSQVTAVLRDDQVYLIAWYDWRLQDQPSSPYRTSIFGQFFDANGWRIGPNVQLDDGSEIENEYPFAQILDGEFDVSWLARSTGYLPYNPYHSRWQPGPRYEGTYVSRPYDTGYDQVVYFGLECVSELSPGAVIQLQLRTGATQEEVEAAIWRAPSTGLAGASNPCTGNVSVHADFDGSRYVQFKTRLVTGDWTRSPILKEVAISFSSPSGLAGDTLPETISHDLWFSPPYPNPASRAVRFEFTLARADRAVLEIFSALGRRTAVPFSGMAAPGQHSVVWDANSQPPGVYHARLRAVGRVITRTVIII